MQQRLWPDAQPLVERLGREFFRRVPESPGVYLLRGATESGRQSEEPPASAWELPRGEPKRKQDAVKHAAIDRKSRQWVNAHQSRASLAARGRATDKVGHRG
jgi:hypothetical protein